MNPFHRPHVLESCVAETEEGSLLKVTPLSDTVVLFQNQASMNSPYTTFMTQIKIDLHTSLSVTAFHSAQDITELQNY
jgi:hypothetical protein